MKYRLANENDRKAVYETIGYCFNTHEDSIKNNIENGPLNKYEQFIVAENDKQEVESVFSIVPFNVYFEGEIVKFGGVAGVSSLPEHRGAGNINNLFKFALKYMKDNNMILSGLGPFAYQYYRKFGYEWTYTWQLVSININDLKGFKEASKYKKLTKENAKEFENFRNKCNQRINGPIIRDERIVNEKWSHYKNSVSHVYAAYENDEIVSMMVYKQEGREIKVSEMYFINETARQYLLNFLYRHRSMTDSVELVLAVDDEIRNILPTPRLKYWHWPNKMGRVVMVKEALELLKLEENFDGSYIIKVNDEHAPWNNTSFKLECKDNRLIVNETNESEDFEVSIQRLSQLILGHVSGKEAIKLELIKTINQDKEKLLNKTFSKRTTMLWQEF